MNLTKSILSLRAKVLMFVTGVFYLDIFSQTGTQTQTWLQNLLNWFIPLAAIFINFRIILALVKTIKKLTDDEEANAKNAAYRQIAMLVAAIVLVNTFWIIMDDWGTTLENSLSGTGR